MSTEQPDQWTPERLARFEEWCRQQNGEHALAEFISVEPTNTAPIAEGTNGTDAHRLTLSPDAPHQAALDPFGRGPSSPFYQPPRKDRPDG